MGRRLRRGRFKVADRGKKKETDENEPAVELEATPQAAVHSEGQPMPAKASTSRASPSASTQLVTGANTKREVTITRQRRHGRGPTLMNDIWELESGVKMEVQVGFAGIPIGLEAGKLSNFIGSIIRRSDLAPLGYKDWRHMEPKYKKAIWEAIEEKIQFRPCCSEKTRTWVMRNASNKWRSWKNDIKNRVFNQKETPRQMWKKVNDARVNRTQFFAIANIWLSEAHQRTCERNRQIRLKYDDPHCTGTKSFARLIHEKALAEGTTPTRADIYITSRRRKDGRAVNDKAKNLMDLMEKYQLETVNSGSHGEASKWQEDVYSKVKGPEKKGKVRCLGAIVPSKMYAATASVEQNMQQTLNGVLDILVGMTHMWKEQFPTANIEDVVATAKRLAIQARAGEAEIADASSVPNNSETEHPRRDNGSCNNPVQDGYDVESIKEPPWKLSPESLPSHMTRSQWKSHSESLVSHLKLGGQGMAPTPFFIPVGVEAPYFDPSPESLPSHMTRSQWKSRSESLVSHLKSGGQGMAPTPFSIPVGVEAPSFDPMLTEEMNNSLDRKSENPKPKRKQTARSCTSMALNVEKKSSKRLKTNAETTQSSNFDRNPSEHTEDETKIIGTVSGQNMNETQVGGVMLQPEVEVGKDTTFSQGCESTIKYERDVIQAFLRDPAAKFNAHFYTPLGNFCLGKHIHNLLYGGMVEDKIIDMYMDVLHHKHSEFPEEPPFFFAALKVTQLVKIRVKRGTNINLVNLFKCHRKSFEHLKKVFCVMLTSNHRHLLVTDFETKKFKVYDSMYGNRRHKREAERWQQFIAQFYTNNYTKDNLYNWELEFVKDCPQQSSYSLDCGIYVMKFMEYLCEDKNPDFTEEDIPRFRREIAATLLTCGNGKSKLVPAF